MTPAPTPPEQSPTTPAPTPPRGWPAWFVSFDVALAVLAVALAFLMASFVARNPDLWRHLASGRLVAQGQYPFGADPFSYTATSGVWVNPNWLADVLLFGLYSADASGAVAVAVKAMAFAAGVGLLFLLKKPGHSVWPWAVAAALGAVAAGAHTHLRPAVFGLPLFVGLLVLLYRADWLTGNKWRMPAAVGGLAAVWANIDGFGFLVPLTVGLVAVGEWLHPKVFSARGEPATADDPFRAPPPLAGLLRALMLAVVGVLLNPTFLAAVSKDAGEAFAQLLPFELDTDGGTALALDSDLGRGTRAGLNDKYMADPLFGNNTAGFVGLAVVVLAAAAAGANFRQGRLSHLLGWVGPVLLAAVVNARFIPYAALASVPLLAAHLNGLGRFVPDPARVSDRIAGGLFSLARLGRAVTLLALVLLVAAAVPGWLHPQFAPQVRFLSRSVAWKVDPDEGMTRAGQVFAGWRADPTTAAAMGTRGLNLHPDLGDYLAWHAPAEKSFVTSRYRLHRNQLADLVAARRNASPPDTQAEREKREDPLGKLIPVADKYQASYLAVGSNHRAVSMDMASFLARGLDPAPAGSRERPVGETLWHADGRLLVVGRADTPEVMRWDAARLVFGTKSAPPPPLTAEQLSGLPPQEGWVSDLLLLRPPVTPPALSDARFYLSHLEYVGRLQGERNKERAGKWQTQEEGRLKGWWEGMRVVGGGLGFTAVVMANQQAGQYVNPQPLPSEPQPVAEPPADAVFALPLLAERSARAAAARAPDDYQSYLELVKVGRLLPDADPPRNLFASSAPTDRQLQVVTALTRALARLPAPKSPQERFAAEAIQVRAELAVEYLRIGYVGSARRVYAELAEVLAGPVTADAAYDAAATVDMLWGAAVEKALGELPPDVQARLQGQPRNQKEADDLMAARMAVLVREKLLAEDDLPGSWLEAYRTEAKANADAAVAAVKAKQAVPPGATAAVRLRAERGAAVLEKIAGRWYTRSGAANLPPEQQFYALVGAGLPDAALDLFPKEGETGKPMPNLPPPDQLRVALWLGYAEDVAKQLPKAKQSLADATGLTANSGALFAAKYRMVEHDLARLLGDYSAAGQLLDELIAAPPPGQPVSAIFIDLWRPADTPPLTPAEVETYRQLAEVRLPGADNVAVLLTAGPVWAGVTEKREYFRRRLLFEAFTHYQRGLYALMAGDPAKAEAAFDQAAKPGGFELAKVPLPQSLQVPLGLLLPKYRELLKKYPK